MVVSLMLLSYAEPYASGFKVTLSGTVRFSSKFAETKNAPATNFKVSGAFCFIVGRNRPDASPDG
jgi:hypothetical protein